MINPIAAVIDLWSRRYWSPPAGGAQASSGRPVVVITGASEGIGLAIAHRFAAAGHELLLIARRPEPLEAASRDIERLHGVAAHTLSLDVSVHDATARIDAALARGGCFADIVVNNAGLGLCAEYIEHAAADITALINVNVGAVSRLTRHFLPAMRERGRGGIINIASLGGYAPGPYQAVYYASKAYVIALTRAGAHEIRGQGVRVCVVTPGPVETRFHERMCSDQSFYRSLVPAASPAAVARATYRGYRLGMRVIQPGLFTPFLALAMRLVPGILLLPLIGALLRPRGAMNARRQGKSG